MRFFISQTRHMFISVMFVLSVFSASACDYRNIKVETESNQQLDKMLSLIVNIKKESTEQSELFRRVNTKDNNALIWSIFAYCVIDDDKISVPFDILSSLNYNQLKIGIPNTNTKEQVVYLLSIFYASIADKPKIGFIRERSIAFEYLDDYFLSVGVSEKDGKILIFEHDEDSESITVKHNAKKKHVEKMSSHC